MKGFIAELKRRNVLRAGLLYAGAVWALAQGISQLGPSVGAPEWITRWFLLAAAVGFPFWLAFAWYYEFTLGGWKRESEVDPTDPVAHATSRKLDFWIVGVLAVAVVLLLTDRFASNGRNVAAAIAETSIAVLPLANASDDPDQVYFSDGLSEDLINALSQFEGLKVISRNSSFQFRDSQDDVGTIGEKLGVTHLLEGSVRRAGDTVRITAQLVDAADGSTVWSQHYDRPFKDLFDLQDEITRTVAAALKARLLPGAGGAAQSERPPSGNLAAYTAMLRGRQYSREAIDEAGFLKAIEALETAIRLDPGYALAYAGQSLVWMDIANFRDGAARDQAIAKARAAAATALARDPDCGPAYNALAALHEHIDGDWARAESEYRQSMHLNPGSTSARTNLARMLLRSGRPEEALDLGRQALTIDPLRPVTYLMLGRTLMVLGRLDEAGQTERKLIEVQPARAPTAHGELALLALLRGDAAAALREAHQTPEDDGQRTAAVAQALQIGTDRAAADAALESRIQILADTAPYQLAELYALRKDPANLFRWLDTAWVQGDPGLDDLLANPLFKPYWQDPRFVALCLKLGRPAPDRAGPAGSA